MPVSVKTKRTGRVQAARLDNAALTAIGTVMVQEQKARWEKGVNADGTAAKPLSKRYTFIKKAYRKVSRPIRDMKMTGRTLENFQLRKAIDGVIRAEPTQRETRRRAQIAQKIEEMIGLAPADQIAIFRATQAKYGDWVKRAWIPIQ